MLLVDDLSLVTATGAATALTLVQLFSPGATDDSSSCLPAGYCYKVELPFSKVLFLLLFLLQWSIVEPVAALIRGGETKELFNTV